MKLQLEISYKDDFCDNCPFMIWRSADGEYECILFHSSLKIRDCEYERCENCCEVSNKLERMRGI